MNVPDCIEDEVQLDELLSRPTPGVVDTFRDLTGDVLILGAGGKMGPTLARMARRTCHTVEAEGGAKRRVIAVSRFSSPGARAQLEGWGVECVACDLLDPSRRKALPDAPNVVYMAGTKFGATGNESHTWAMNTYLPGVIAEQYRNSRIAAFSTGNVYGLVPVHRGGSLETDAPRPDGEYAMSCLGRERILEHFSRVNRTPICIIRLNYACELRYGVLVDLAQRVWHGDTIDVSMGHFNILWQGDANAMALCMLAQAESPARKINLTGPEILRCRSVCEAFAEIMGKPLRLAGEEKTDALLSDATWALKNYGAPQVGAERLIRWVAHWVMHGGPSLAKPTHFEVRDGVY